jgi:hypothetical protein
MNMKEALVEAQKAIRLTSNGTEYFLTQPLLEYPDLLDEEPVGSDSEMAHYCLNRAVAVRALRLLGFPQDEVEQVIYRICDVRPRINATSLFTQALDDLRDNESSDAYY